VAEQRLADLDLAHVDVGADGDVEQGLAATGVSKASGGASARRIM
jgi:hypothetical protein